MAAVLIAVVVAASALLSLAAFGSGGSVAPTSTHASAAVVNAPEVITRCPPCIINIVSRNLPKAADLAKPASLTWGVAISGVDNGELQTTNTTEISIGDLPNGVYHYLVVGPSGWVAANESGSVTLNDDNATVNTAFSQAPTHDLIVRESGLPKGTLWCATVASALTLCSSAVSQRAENLTPAVYNFSVAGAAGYELKYPAPTTVDLTDGSLIVHLVYRPTLYALTFAESGLASGTVWRLTLYWASGTPIKNHHVRRATSGSSLVFEVTNGTYNYTVVPIRGYDTPTEVPITVDGASLTHDLAFTAIPSAVTFTEKGLASGLTWSITINNKTYTTNTTQIVVTLTVGKYGYTIGVPSGYTARGSPVAVKVDGSPVSVKITFRAG